MSEIVVRATARSDAARVADIWMDGADYYAELDPDAFRIPVRAEVERIPVGEESESALSIVAEIDGTVAGFLDAHLEEPAADAAAQMMAELGGKRVVVDALVVERRYWRRGAGSALLLAAEDWGRARGAAVVALDTYYASPVSVPFYEKRMGYARRSLNLRKKL